MLTYAQLSHKRKGLSILARRTTPDLFKQGVESAPCSSRKNWALHTTACRFLSAIRLQGHPDNPKPLTTLQSNSVIIRNTPSLVYSEPATSTKPLQLTLSLKFGLNSADQPMVGTFSQHPTKISAQTISRDVRETHTVIIKPIYPKQCDVEYPSGFPVSVSAVSRNAISYRIGESATRVRITYQGRIKRSRGTVVG
jgi:hypothetical protein